MIREFKYLTKSSLFSYKDNIFFYKIALKSTVARPPILHTPKLFPSIISEFTITAKVAAPHIAELPRVIYSTLKLVLGPTISLRSDIDKMYSVLQKLSRVYRNIKGEGIL